MIEFSDGTLRESENYQDVCNLMTEADGCQLKWMLCSDVLVDTDEVVARYSIHFWWDGRAVIMETDHPPLMEVPESDILALRDWAALNGWKLCLNKLLLNDPGAFIFWLRFFRAGVIHSEVLDMYEKEEIKRFQKAFDKLSEEEV